MFTPVTFGICTKGVRLFTRQLRSKYLGSGLCCYSSHHLSAVKPGVLLLKTHSSSRVEVLPAKYSADLTACTFNIESTASSAAQVYVEQEHERTIIDVELPQDSCNSNAPAWCVYVPHHYAIELTGSGQVNIHLTKLEPDSLSVRLEDGNCELHKIKTTDCQLRGSTANFVLAKTFLGNIDAAVQNGSFLADKIQGNDINVTTDSGNIHINTLYASKASCRCHHGNIAIGNAHGYVSLQTHTGDISLQSLEGSLVANTSNGNVSAHLTNAADVDVSCKSGSAHISLPESISSEIYIESQDVRIDDSLTFNQSETDSPAGQTAGTIGEYDHPGRQMNITALSVRLEAMDWLKAQKINFCSDLDH